MKIKTDNILIVHAHPEPASFCSSLSKEAANYFIGKNSRVKVSDLYSMMFNPVGGKHDFISLKNPDYFKYQAEQVHAFEHDLFAPELKEEMDKLIWADVIIFNFPLWWFGLPAILKGWVDRVFAMGLAYGNGKGVYENGTFKEKTAFCCITTGGPEQAYNGGKNGDLDKILFPVHHGMFYFSGMTVLPPFIAFSPARQTMETLSDELKHYKDYLENIELHTPLYSNRD
jgi:NAD(P)H dehydrogenase (quinone)